MKRYEVKKTRRISKVSDNGFSFKYKNVAVFLGVIASVLILASLTLNLITYFTGHETIYGLVRLFYLDQENNIPSLFSVFLLQTVAFLLLIIAVLKKKDSQPTVYWLVLLFGFLYISLDEGVGIHENIGDWSKFHGLLHFAWIIPFFFILPVLFIFFMKFLAGLSSRTRKYFLLAGFLYVGGAVGFESIGGYISEKMGYQSLWYYSEVTVEEGLEMFGTILFIYALLDYLYQNYKEVRIVLHKDEKSSLMNSVSSDEELKKDWVLPEVSKKSVTTNYKT